MEPMDLLVLGDVNPDLVMRGGDVVPAFGQAERVVEEATLTIGGSGAILACGAARLGLRVALCGLVGDDLFGRFMCDALRERQVDIRGLVVDPDGVTGITVVLAAPGDRAMLTATGSMGSLRIESVDRELLDAARHVHVSSYFLQSGLWPDLQHVFDDVHRRGGTTSVDPNWDPSGMWDAGVMRLLPHTDVFLPNAMEAMQLAHISDLDEAIRRLRAETSMVVVKQGAGGALASTTGETAQMPSIPAQVVDATGAGDSFDAGFLTAWLADMPLERCLAIGNACGALSTRVVGGTSGQATMDEVLEAIERGSAA